MEDVGRSGFGSGQRRAWLVLPVARSFGFRTSDFLRHSAFGLRISGVILSASLLRLIHPMTPPPLLLIGKIGQVGWELRRTLAPMAQVTCVDFPEIDLTSPDSIRQWVRDTNPRVIINAAAYTA